MTDPLVLGTAALIVVDIQPLTLPNAVALPPEELLPAIAELVAAARDARALVVYALSTGTPRGTTAHGAGGRRWPEELVAVAPPLAPSADELVVRRAAWSAFSGTDLQQTLTERGIDTVVIAGLATTFGVESTARAAYDAGFEVVIASDAISGPDGDAHDRAITSLFPALSRVATVEVIAAALRG